MLAELESDTCWDWHPCSSMPRYLLYSSLVFHHSQAPCPATIPVDLPALAKASLTTHTLHVISTDGNKTAMFRSLAPYTLFNNVQCFLGLVQYLVHYMPDINAYTTPLLGCIRNGCPFEWTPLLDKCFKSIKTLACKATILKPINHDNPDPIWVITNGSKAGVGAIYGQGPNWKTCQPAGFMSKKFSNAQQHY